MPGFVILFHILCCNFGQADEYRLFSGDLILKEFVISRFYSTNPYLNLPQSFSGSPQTAVSRQKPRFESALIA